MAFVGFELLLIAVLCELLHLESFMCASDTHKLQVGYTTGKVLCVHLQVPCQLPSQSSQRSKPCGDEGGVWGKALAAVNLNVMLQVSLLYVVPGAVTCLPSRVRACPGRDMMLLRRCSRTPLVSIGITNTSARCILKIEMEFLILPRKFIVFLKLFYQTSFFTER